MSSIVVLEKYLDDNYLHAMLDEIKYSSSGAWHKVIRHEKLEQTISLIENIANYKELQVHYHNLLDSVRNEKLTYCFSRVLDHRHCGCWQCNFKRVVLFSDQFRQAIIDNTSLTNPILNDVFTSAYYPGDMLARHTDKGRGMAFVFHLNLDWKPEYGGIFHAQNDTGYQAYIPPAGSVVMMDLKDGGIVHYVSEVTRYAPGPRLAISGWFDEQ